MAELPRGGIQRAAGVIDQANRAGRDSLLQIHLQNALAMQVAAGHRLRHKGQAQVTAHQRQHLVGGAGFDVGFQLGVML